MTLSYTTGQSWTWVSPEGFEQSRVVIGAIEQTAGGGEVVCVAITGLPVPAAQGEVQLTTISFVPFTREAIDASLKENEGEQPVPDAFTPALEQWRANPEGPLAVPVPLPNFLAEVYRSQSQQ